MESLTFILIIGLLILIGVLLAHKAQLKRKNSLLTHAFNNPIPKCITNSDYEIILANDAYWNFWGKPENNDGLIKCYDNRPGKACHTDKCPLSHIMNGESEYICYPDKVFMGGLRHFKVTATPLFDKQKKVIGVVETFEDITEQRKADDAKEDLIKNLEESLKEANTLSGFLPICASCKKIRNDEGYWDQIEEYISSHSTVEFSHGICPECINNLYPGVLSKTEEGN